MAYRFLLEVPEHLADEANAAVGSAGDAQVVVVRKSTGLGYDLPSLELVVAAHTLSVISPLYDWIDTLGDAKRAVRIVLHSGDRVTLDGVDRNRLIAAVRRDQPWVERTIPMIGEHDDQTGLGRGTLAVATTTETEAVAPAANEITFRAYDLPKAERFYTEFMAMELVGRARANAAGKLETLPANYDWQAAHDAGVPADVSYLRNGSVSLAIHRVGLGARISPSELDTVTIHVSPADYTTLKGNVLMRSYEILGQTDNAFAYRDPFFLTWEVVKGGTPDYTL